MSMTDTNIRRRIENLEAVARHILMIAENRSNVIELGALLH